MPSTSLSFIRKVNLSPKTLPNFPRQVIARTGSDGYPSRQECLGKWEVSGCDRFTPIKIYSLGLDMFLPRSKLRFY